MKKILCVAILSLPVTCFAAQTAPTLCPTASEVWLQAQYIKYVVNTGGTQVIFAHEFGTSDLYGVDINLYLRPGDDVGMIALPFIKATSKTDAINNAMQQLNSLSPPLHSKAAMIGDMYTCFYKPSVIYSFYPKRHGHKQKSLGYCPNASALHYNAATGKYTAPGGWESASGRPTGIGIAFGDAVIVPNSTAVRLKMPTLECDYYITFPSNKQDGNVFSMQKLGTPPVFPHGSNWQKQFVSAHTFMYTCAPNGGYDEPSLCPFKPYGPITKK